MIAVGLFAEKESFSMIVSQMQQEILRLKKEKDICILAHSYQAAEIQEIADFCGDSFALSKKAAAVANKTVVMCGVRFMAETVKLLSPEKRVVLASPDAGCPMAEQLDAELLLSLKEALPEYTVVAYINTTAELKAHCDVCVTSLSAVEVVRKIKNNRILFIPDCNLGDWVSKQVPEKEFKFVNGGCPIHARVRENDVKAAKAAHPDALLLVHPECRPAVAALADYVGSTSGIVDFAVKSSVREFIIGTEISIVETLKYACPDKKFYPLSKNLICPNMKLTTLPDVLDSLVGGGEEITLDGDIMKKARVCIERMLDAEKP